MPAPEEHQPHPVDLHVGAMVRTRRKLLGVSQEGLADKLGLTFQQVQKYERGANRISASKLYLIAQALDCTPAYFFDGLPTAGEPLEPDSDAFQLLSMFGALGGVQIARLFTELRVDQRMGLIKVIKAVVDMTPHGERALAA